MLGDDGPTTGRGAPRSSSCSSGASRKPSACIRRSSCSCARCCATSRSTATWRPAGSLAMVSPALSHRLRRRVRRARSLRPRSLRAGRQEDRRHRHALIGFGGGHHRCIGSTFAYQQIKVIWSVLLRRFELDARSPRPAPDYTTFVVAPARRASCARRRSPPGLTRCSGKPPSVRGVMNRRQRSRRRARAAAGPRRRPRSDHWYAVEYETALAPRARDPRRRSGGRPSRSIEPPTAGPRARGPLSAPPAPAVARRVTGGRLRSRLVRERASDLHDRSVAMPSLRIGRIRSAYGLVVFPGDPDSRRTGSCRSCRSARGPTRGRTCRSASRGARITRW